MAGGAGKTYEMMWDCRYCGTRKNLGKTHRHCPNCGAPQDATARYFPAESEKVAVEDHFYAGADVQCAGCGVWNGRAARCCAGCGAPLEGVKELQRRQDQVAGLGGFQGETVQAARQEHQARALLGAHGPPGAPGTGGGFAGQQTAAGGQAAKKPLSKGLLAAIGCGGLVLALVIGLVISAFWTREASLEVTAATWSRQIAVESLQTVRESAWCDRMPSGARRVSRSREVRSHEKIADGETCTNRRVDNGDGTYREVRDCQPRYREKPVYDEKCSFDVDRWQNVRKAEAQGTFAEEPRWPPVTLARTGTSVGAEREGPRTEAYLVRFRHDEADDDECTFDQARWRRFRPGVKVKAQVRVLTGGVDCDEVQPP